MVNFKNTQTLFLDYLASNQFHKQPQDLYDPINYILDLGGKRVRPILLLLGYGLFDENIEKALPAAYAIELFHNFSLMHDDIMDEAPLRRGQASVHIKYDINTGILSGDAMLIHAYKYLMQIAPHHNMDVIINSFNEFAIDVCEGQQMDMNFEKRNDVKISEYLKMIELKTAVLLGGALKIGALIAEADQEAAEQIYQFGKNIGIAFQLQDDLLDTYGDPAKFGKKVGGDIIQSKKTYLYLKTLELCDNDSERKLSELFSNDRLADEKKIILVKDIFNEWGIKGETESKMAHYQDIAFNQLGAIAIPEAKKTGLVALAEMLLDRDH